MSTPIAETLDVRAFLESSDSYPIDFDQAWKWVGYKRKDYAKNCLIANFERGVDFLSELQPPTQNGGRPREVIKLTIDCFKRFQLMNASKFPDGANKKHQQGFVYLIQNANTGNLKIGYSLNPSPHSLGKTIEWKNKT